MAGRAPAVGWWPKAVALWLEGYDGASIGRAVGVSRQRIDQLRDAFPERPWIRPGEQGYAHAETLTRWAGQGRIRRSPGGFYHREDVEAVVVELMERPCNYPGCEDVVGDIHGLRRFCDLHSEDVKHYQYPVLSPERKRKYQERMDGWKRRNPERAREIQRRARRAWRQRHPENLERRRERYHADPARRERHREYMRQYNARKRTEAS